MNAAVVSTEHGSGLSDRLVTLGLVDWPAPIHIDRADVEALCSTAPHEGLVCLLGAAVERGFVTVDDPSIERVASLWAQRLSSVVQLDAALCEAVACLRTAGIASRVLKGAAVATLDEFDPSWRSYGDVDILVPPDQLIDAVDALARLNLRPVVEPVSRRWAARYAKSVTLVGDSGLQVDLHRLLTAGPFGTRLLDAPLFEQGRDFTAGGHRLVAMSDVDRFLHACYHAELGGIRGCRHRRDVLLLARGVEPGALAQAHADGWSLTVVANALRWANGPSAALSGEWTQWVRTFDEDPSDAALVNSYRGSFQDVAREAVRAEHGILAKVHYAAALVWPSRAHLAARHERRWAHLRRIAVGRRRR